MSIELDRRTDLPIPQPPKQHPYRHQDEKQTDYNAYQIGPYSSDSSAQLHAPRKPTHAPRKSTFFLLSAALAIMTVLAVVSAAVGGSIAVRRKHEINRLEELLEDHCAANITAASGDENSTSSSTSSASAPIPIPYDPFKDNIIPSRNCSAMGSTYISANSHAPFTIHCNTNYPGSDMLSVWVFTFADCMEACSKYNALQGTPPCYAVSYGPTEYTEQSGLGNCWLKTSNNVAARSTNVTDSGVFNFDS